MSRNRMKNSQSLHWMGVMKWIMIVGLLSVLGLSYMFCKNQNMHMAEEVRGMQNQLGAIRKRNETLAFDLEKMKTLDELKRRLVAMRSPLVPVSTLRFVALDQNTRMRLVQMGTQPSAALNLEPPVATAEAPASQH